MDSTGREKTIQYVSEKYGKEKVAVIVTFGEMKGKSAIRDCARAIQLPLERSNYLAKLVPDNAKSLAQAIYGDEKKKVEAVPELRRTLEDEPCPASRAGQREEKQDLCSLGPFCLASD